MTPDPRENELHKETLDVIRFLIQDHAFATEFLVTAVQEYYQRNMKGRADFDKAILS